MIVHVLNKAKESSAGEVIVATPDQEIIDVVKKNGGNTVLTKNEHPSGSDRVYEAYMKNLKKKFDLIINLQGDMPNIKPNSISKLERLMRNDLCDIGTLAAYITDKNDIKDPNVVKVNLEKNLKEDNFFAAKDFFRTKKDLNNDKIYHHCGIYIFTRDALSRYVNLPRSKLEIERSLEQMRAMENNMKVKVGLCNFMPLSVDTEEDLKKVSEEMKKL